MWKGGEEAGGASFHLYLGPTAPAAHLPPMLPAQAAAVHAGVPVQEYIEAHPPPMEPVGLEPDAHVAEAYREAFERHKRLGEGLYGGKKGSDG